MCTFQLLCICNHQTMADIYRRTKCPESFQVKIKRTASDITSTRKSYLRMFIFSKECSQQIIGCSDLTDIFIVHNQIMNK